MAKSVIEQRLPSPGHLRISQHSRYWEVLQVWAEVVCDRKSTTAETERYRCSHSRLGFTIFVVLSVARSHSDYFSQLDVIIHYGATDSYRLQRDIECEISENFSSSRNPLLIDFSAHSFPVPLTRWLRKILNSVSPRWSPRNSSQYVSQVSNRSQLSISQLETLSQDRRCPQRRPS